jgi:hypothetical protein
LCTELSAAARFGQFFTSRQASTPATHARRRTLREAHRILTPGRKLLIELNNLAGFNAVAFYDNQGDPLTAESRRTIAVATR